MRRSKDCDVDGISRQLAEVDAVDLDPSFLWICRACNDFQKRHGISRIGSDQAHELARLEAEIEILQRSVLETSDVELALELCQAFVPVSGGGWRGQDASNSCC